MLVQSEFKIDIKFHQMEIFNFDLVAKVDHTLATVIENQKIERRETSQLTQNGRGFEIL